MRAVVHVGLAAIVVGVAAAWPSAEVEMTAFALATAPPIAEIRPTGEELVGVAHPVVVTFDDPVTNRRAAERAVRVLASPPMTGQFEWLEDNVVQWVPDDYWPANSIVTLSVGTRWAEFKTGPAVIGVADISDHTFTVTIDGQEAGPPIPLPAPHHLPRAGEEGVLLASMGRPEYPTPVGKYSVLEKNREVVMDSSSVGIRHDAPDGYLMPVDHAVRITWRGIYIHPAPWAVKSMGIENVSHGCIGLIPAAAEWYFNTVKIGDPVIVQE